MKCAHCATPKATNRWLPAICADKRKRRSKWLCDPCDLLLNRLVLEFFNDKDADRKMAEYAALTPTPNPTRPTAMTLDEYTAEFNRLSAAAGWIPYRAGQLATFMLDGDTPAEALEMELAYADKEGRDAI